MLINESQINLDGSITGTITDVTNKQGDVEPYAFAKKALDTGAKGLKTGKNLKEFRDGVEESIGILNKPDGDLSTEERKKRDAMGKLEKGLLNLASDNNAIGAGLRALPYVGTALSVVDFFVAKEEKPMTMSINAQVVLQGSIVDEDLFLPISMSTPGSKGAADPALAGLYPKYNERLGVLNLLNTPRVKVKRMTTRWQSDMDWIEAQMTTHGYAYEDDYRLGVNVFFNTGEREGFHRCYNLQLIDMPEIVINPAAGFKMDNPDIMVALVVKKKYALLLRDTLFPQPVRDGKELEITFQSQMMNASCQLDSYSQINFTADDVFRFWVAGYNHSPLTFVELSNNSQFFHKDERFYIKIFANLERVDNGERVLHVVEYPVEIVPTSDFTNTNKIEEDDLLLELENESINANSKTEALYVEYGENVALNTVLMRNHEINGYAGIHIKPGAHISRRQNTTSFWGNSAHFFTGGGAPCFSAPVNLANDKTAAFCSSGIYTADRIISKKPQGGNPVSIPGELETLRFELMPNPTYGHTTVRWSSSEIADQSVWVSVVDISGTEVVSRKVSVTDELMQFDLSDLSNGVYMVQLKTESGYTGIRKLVKQ
jgi:hypothetical protein